MNKHETQKAAPESFQLKCGFFYFSKNLWNARKRNWNALWALGTPPLGLLERPKGPWNRASGSIWNALRALGTEPPALPGTVLPRRGVRGVLERAKRSWNALGLLEPSGADPQALLPAHWG